MIMNCLDILEIDTIVGKGTSEYRIVNLTPELISLVRVSNGARRDIPVIVVNKLLDAIVSGQITLDQVLRKNMKPKRVFDVIGFNYDVFIMGYDTTIHKICQVCLDNQHKASNSEIEENTAFDIGEFCVSMTEAGFKIDAQLIIRFASLLCTKPFAILTGLSGSGKTKLAQAFAEWICADESQICIVSVGADWTNREPLLGFPNALESGKYVKPENGVLDLLIEAAKAENAQKPYFLILDEMNLSHVERYFADFLSAMESGHAIRLHPGGNQWKINGTWADGIPDKVCLPKNLFIIGTVNIDETTYMFSPKVLDRAGVIEFRVTANEMEAFLRQSATPDLAKLRGNGARMGADFIAKAAVDVGTFADADVLNQILLHFFTELKKIGAEFGYRTAYEILRFAGVVTEIAGTESPWRIEEIADAAIIQKLLPKIHGSRRKLEPALRALAELCLSDIDQLNKTLNRELGFDFTTDSNIRFPMSLEKIHRMYQRLVQDGFTSFAEA